MLETNSKAKIYRWRGYKPLNHGSGAQFDKTSDPRQTSNCSRREQNDSLQNNMIHDATYWASLAAGLRPEGECAA